MEINEKNGVVILALNDVLIDGSTIRIVQPMHDIMDSLPNSEYIGTLVLKKNIKLIINHYSLEENKIKLYKL